MRDRLHPVYGDPRRHGALDTDQATHVPESPGAFYAQVLPLPASRTSVRDVRGETLDGATAGEVEGDDQESVSVDVDYLDRQVVLRRACPLWTVP